MRLSGQAIGDRKLIKAHSTASRQPGIGIGYGQRALRQAGVEFIQENGGGPGVRLMRRGTLSKTDVSE